MESLGFTVKRMSGTSGGIMHNKYAIIDRKLLLTGSYNWSASAEGGRSGWQAACVIHILALASSGGLSAA